jgi:acetyl esterase/lipase
MRAARSIDYRPGPRGKLDVWRPTWSDDDHTKRPVVVWIYGGYWQTGERGWYRPLAFPFTSAGCVVVVPDYRLYPEVRFPTFIDDCAAAVAWAYRHAAEFGGDPHRIYLAGHSAGAYIVAMLNLDERYLARAGVPPGTIKGAICLSAPLWFIPNNDAMRGIFGTDDGPAFAQTQPRTFVDGREPPMLLLQGDQDELVRPGTNRDLAQTIRAKGGRATAVSYPAMGHAGPLVSMVWPLWGAADVRAWCLRFLQENGAW